MGDQREFHRAELTEAERREHIAEWVRLTAEKMPHGAVFSTVGAGRGNEGAIAKAAKDLGLSKDTVARAVAAESLPTPVKAAADKAGLGTVDRVAVSREPTAEAQAAKVEELAEAKAERAQAARAPDRPNRAPHSSRRRR